MSDRLTRPRRPLAVRLPKLSLAVTGSPAGTVALKLSEQLPTDVRHVGLRIRPLAVDRWPKLGRTRLPSRLPRTWIRWPAPGPRVRSALLIVSRDWPPLAGALSRTE